MKKKTGYNVKKTKLMLAGSKTMLSLFHDNVDLQMNSIQVERVYHVNILE